MKTKLCFVILFVLIAVTLTATITGAQGPKPTPPKPKAPTAQLGTGFTFQGQLKKNGALVTSSCDFIFSLWTAASGGYSIGNIDSLPAVNVTNGLFTVQVNATDNFPHSAFQGDDRWLEVVVKCTGDDSFVTLGRQKLTAAPYALGLKPGAAIIGDTTNGLYSESTASGGNGIYGVANNGVVAFGVYGASSSGYGVVGVSTGSGAGVKAGGSSTAAALEIGLGAIKVSGAGIGSSTAVFIHQVSGSSYFSCINHSMINGDPNAILIVTSQTYWNGTTGVNNGKALGVYYDVTGDLCSAGRWLIHNLDWSDMTANARFNVMIIKP